MNALIAFFVRLLELLFVIGAIGCSCSVIPITAYRLFMVLFEPESPAREARVATQAQRAQSSSAPQAKAAAASDASVMAQTQSGKNTPPSSPVLETR